MRKLRWRRGFFRLWLVLSGGWLLFVSSGPPPDWTTTLAAVVIWPAALSSPFAVAWIARGFRARRVKRKALAQ
jgi:hypothetical protein